ncbi:MAG TPA: 23S rRNA (adenine(2503)-C(2))-methyltransferase RlmN [Dehalococcoidia bacterium]|nr:23S rRNA (adenine(2503)-C(2))-methyltransferase RlmN [Dehalococcoidia bacterium]
MHKTLLGLNKSELETLTKTIGESGYRGRQIGQWLYQHSVHTIEDMTSLPAQMRTRLATEYEVGRSQIAALQRSKDNTIKLLLKLHDSETIETVGIPYADRFSCCVSTQVGCPVGCAFCATGQSGFKRNLTAGEIIDQVLSVQETAQKLDLPTKNNAHRISHVVFMGMGEPLLNYEATIQALHLLNEELGIAMRHLTISTVGFVPGIRSLAQENLQITLAISLHAPTDELRRKLIPSFQQWTVEEIIRACRDYVKLTGRRITFEYCLLRGINDNAAAAQQLASLLKGLNCHVNLIPYNAVETIPFRAPFRESIQSFRETLESAGIIVTQRQQRGASIAAACGQLRERSDA